MAIAIAQVGAFLPHEAQAWDDLGHQTVGEIAERYLDEKGKALVFDILGSEPLAVAATFPDHVRSDWRYGDKEHQQGGLDFSPYHFLEIPFGKTFNQLKAENRAKKDAHVIISQGVDLLRDRMASRDKKMVMLRYLVHVVGDVHQPLHIGNGTDMGANLCKVLWTPAPTPFSQNPRPFENNLHSVWDGKIFDYMKADVLEAQKKKEQEGKGKASKWFGYAELGYFIGQDIRKLTAEQMATIQNAPISTWYDESQSLHAEVYPPNKDGSAVNRPTDRKYCIFVDAQGKPQQGQVPKEAIPTLTAEYAAKAVPIVKARVMKGGLRLAQMINQIAANSPLSAGQGADLELLRSIELKNEAGHDTEHGHGRDNGGAEVHPTNPTTPPPANNGRPRRPRRQ